MIYVVRLLVHGTLHVQISPEDDNPHHAHRDRRLVLTINPSGSPYATLPRQR